MNETTNETMPCIECITYAICRPKTAITCDYLYKYIELKSPNVKGSKKNWTRIQIHGLREILPNLGLARPETYDQFKWSTVVSSTGDVVSSRIFNRRNNS